ncbi:hypothetical protein Mapa_017188 [Marchantia paleacea]|nr:hypothetical protein Mapa_017188 [Marchantia paleacea]
MFLLPNQTKRSHCSAPPPPSALPSLSLSLLGLLLFLSSPSLSFCPLLKQAQGPPLPLRLSLSRLLLSVSPSFLRRHPSSVSLSLSLLSPSPAEQNRWGPTTTTNV